MPQKLNGTVMHGAGFILSRLYALISVRQDVSETLAFKAVATPMCPLRSFTLRACETAAKRKRTFFSNNVERENARRYSVDVWRRPELAGHSSENHINLLSPISAERRPHFFIAFDKGVE